MEKKALGSGERSVMNRIRRKRWQKVMIMLAAVVVFCTTYALILPAITRESQTYCGMEEHLEHTESCYGMTPVCGLEECEGHTHTEDCMGVICLLEETPGHTHTAECGVQETRRLVCGQEECEGHTHGGECYSEPFLTCEDNSEEHVHDESCYSRTLICTLAEQPGHVHGEDCYKTETVYCCGLEETPGHAHGDGSCIMGSAILCGLEEKEGHQHTEACMAEGLICGLPIHSHTLQCFSDPNADRENLEVWARINSVVERSGKWNEDVAAIAVNQLGCGPSERNYMVEEDGATIRGYTRYGDWYGDPYGDWDAMFASFCISYAGVDKDAFPYESDCERWVETLSREKLYFDRGEREPEVGCLIFFDYDKFEREDERKADHVGVVTKLTTDEETGRLELITAIEGDHDNIVARWTYEPDCRDILGYAFIPENPEYVDLVRYGVGAPIRTIESVPASDGAVAVITGALPEGAEAVISAVPLSMDEMIAYFGEEKAAAMGSYVAYDIKIMVDGEEWQPDNTVTVTVKQSELTGESEGVFAVAHVDDETNEISDVSGQLAENGEISFDTDGFSVYIFYTVDFHYGDLVYSIAGEDSILLSELFRVLGVNVSVGSVVDVSFSKETLVSVESAGDNDWLLTSLAPFTSTEELNITLNNGQTFTIIVTDAQTGASGATDLSAYLKTTGANDWQIVSQGYKGNSVTYKKACDGDGDGKPDVYIQKNVVPTDTENEFLVYLSIDKHLDASEIFDRAVIGLTNSNKYKDYLPGRFVYETPAGNPTYMLEEGVQGGYTNKYWVHFVIYEKQEFAPSFDRDGNMTVEPSGPVLYDYWAERYGDTPNASNGTGFIQFAGHDGFLVVARQITLKGEGAGGHGNPLTYHIGLSSIMDFSSLYQTVLDEVVDEMGDNIIFDSVVAGDFDPASTYFDDTKNKLYWTPVESNGDPDVDFNIPIDGWARNIAQLVYKVRLNTSAANFDSCAERLQPTDVRDIAYPDSYKVNNSAVLNYHKEAIEGARPDLIKVNPPLPMEKPCTSANFQIPYVRGLLYDLWFQKVADDESHTPLQGAQFKLKLKDGSYMKADDGVTDRIFTSNENGIVELFDLPQSQINGVVGITEVAPPPFYQPPSTDLWQIPLNYTASKTSFVSDTLNNKADNMRYTGFTSIDNKWLIENEREPGQPIVFRKVDEKTGNPIKDAVFELHGADDSGNMLSEPLEGMTGMKSAANGVFSPENFQLGYGTYYLVETTPRKSYKPLGGSAKIVVSEDNVTVTPAFTIDDEQADVCTLTEENGIYTITVKNRVKDPTEPVKPDDPPYPADDDRVSLSKQIDYLGDNAEYVGKGMDDLYRLYLTMDIQENPIDLLLVVDQSSSMTNDVNGASDDGSDDFVSRQELIDEFLNGTNSNGFIKDFLAADQGNKLAVLTFGSDCNSSCIKLNWTGSADHVDLDPIVANTATNYASALYIADQMLNYDDAVANDGNKKVMLFLSDGEPTVAYSDGKMHNTFAETEDCRPIGTGGANYTSISERLRRLFTGVYNEQTGGSQNRQSILNTTTLKDYESPANVYPQLRYYGANTENSSFPVGYDLYTADVTFPGLIGDFPYGEIDAAAFAAWVNSVTEGEGDLDIQKLSEILAWVSKNWQSMVNADGEKFDLFYATESAFQQFRTSNPNVYVYTLGFGSNTNGTYPNGRPVSEVMEYMASDTGDQPSGRFYQWKNTETMMQNIKNVAGVRNIKMTDPLSEYVDPVAEPGLEIRLTDAKYSNYYETGEEEEFAYLYKDGDFTELGELLLDTAKTKYDAAARTVSVVMDPDLVVYEKIKIEASFNVRVNEHAADTYDANQFNYPVSGDTGTDYPRNNTSSEKPGFYSNNTGDQTAQAEWTHGKDRSEPFPKPVVQVPDPVDVRLKKIVEIVEGEQETYLSGAEFFLFKECAVEKDESGEIIVPEGAVNLPGLPGRYGFSIYGDENRIAISDKDVGAVMEELRYGHYVLYEVKAPDGYVPALGPLEFDLKLNGVIEIDENEEDLINGQRDITDNMLLLMVENSSGTELPMTGGSGTNLYTYGGLTLIVTAWMLGFSLRRRRKGGQFA